MRKVGAQETDAGGHWLSQPLETSVMAANNVLMLKRREEMRAGKALEEAFKVFSFEK